MGGPQVSEAALKPQADSPEFFVAALDVSQDVLLLVDTETCVIEKASWQLQEMLSALAGETTMGLIHLAVHLKMHIPHAVETKGVYKYFGCIPVSAVARELPTDLGPSGSNLYVSARMVSVANGRKVVCSLRNLGSQYTAAVVAAAHPDQTESRTSQHLPGKVSPPQLSSTDGEDNVAMKPSSIGDRKRELTFTEDPINFQPITASKFRKWSVNSKWIVPEQKQKGAK